MFGSRRALALLVAGVTAAVWLAPAVAAAQPRAAGAAPHGPATARGRGGAVATVETLATRAGVRALRHGGNAVDAAVTAAAVLAVTEPFSCGLGGGGYVVLYDAARRRVVTLDGRETAPAAMTPDSFFEGGAVLPFEAARYSGLSTGVPATVATWAALLRRYGTFSLHRALAPAIRVASEGFVVDQTLHDQIEANRDWFADVPATAALYLDAGGSAPAVGSVLRDPDLAQTLAHIGSRGPRAFYRGPVARATVATVSRPPVAASAAHRWRPGVLTLEDLRAYRPRWLAPTRVRYRGYTVYGAPPSSSGGSTVGEALDILRGYPLPKRSHVDVVQRTLEASRYSFADRGAYVADPAYVRVPLAGLLSRPFAAARRALITDVAATSPVAPGDPWPYQKRPAPASPQETHTGSTTHLSVSDARGDIVSYTFTIEAIGGNGLVVPGYGFLLNNELTDFTYDSTTAANRVQGGKRPRSSICPTIVFRGGEPLLTVGSPGGASIITTVLQLLVDRLDRGLTLPRAIAEPRASQRNAATTQAEPAFLASPLAAALEARGYVFAETPEIGAATGIEFLGRGRVLAAAEPLRRGGGSAMVVTPGR